MAAALLLLSACTAGPQTGRQPTATVTTTAGAAVTTTASRTPSASPATQPTTEPSARPDTATVKSVHDGDTFTTTGGDKVRVLGIDAPEVPPAGNDCFGREAADRAKELLENRQVTLTADPAQGTGPEHLDPYGRLLRYVETQAADFAAAMLTDGYARVYAQYPVARTPAYETDQEQARQAGRGLWGLCPND